MKCWSYLKIFSITRTSNEEVSMFRTSATEYRTLSRMLANWWSTLKTPWKIHQYLCSAALQLIRLQNRSPKMFLLYNCTHWSYTFASDLQTRNQTPRFIAYLLLACNWQIGWGGRTRYRTRLMTRLHLSGWKWKITLIFMLQEQHQYSENLLLGCGLSHLKLQL